MANFVRISPLWLLAGVRLFSASERYVCVCRVGGGGGGGGGARGGGGSHLNVNAI